MDLPTAALWILNYFSVFHPITVGLTNWLLWTLLVNIPLGGFVAEEAEETGLSWPLAWGTTIAVLPIALPLFLLVRRVTRSAPHHRGYRGDALRNRGYVISLLALAVILVLAVIVIPDQTPGVYTAPSRSSAPATSTF